MRNTIRQFISSLRYALIGIVCLFRENRNARFELTIAILTICASIAFRITVSEWLIILVCIGMVLSAEGINSSIEKLADKLHPDFAPEIGKVKDLAAGSVLILSFVAAIVGFIIFAPYFVKIFTK